MWVGARRGHAWPHLSMKGSRPWHPARAHLVHGIIDLCTTSVITPHLIDSNQGQLVEGAPLKLPGPRSVSHGHGGGRTANGPPRLTAPQDGT